MSNRYLGERILQNCGEYAEIIELLPKGMCRVRFDSGVERECSRSEFTRSRVPKNVTVKRHVGERVLQRCGDWAEIIELLSTKHCVVRFDNGVIKTCLRKSFSKGTVSSTVKTNRHVGERVLQKCGEWAEIIELLPNNECKVKFDSGTIRVCSRVAFKVGSVLDPKSLSNIDVGMRVKQVCGEYAEVIKLLPHCRCVVKFDSGAIRKCSRTVFESGELVYSNKSDRYVGERVLQKYGEWAELIELLPSGKCKIRFDSGVEKVCCRPTFSGGHLTSKELGSRFVGEKIQQIGGEVAELVELLPKGRCRVKFANGVEKIVTRGAFSAGTLSPLERDACKVGLRVFQECGEWAEVVERVSETRCIVRLDSGIIREVGISYFKTGSITFDARVRSKVGEKVLQTYGVIAEFVKHTSSGKCIVRLEDGSEFECWCTSFRKGLVLPSFIKGRSRKYAYTNETVLSMYFDVNIEHYVGVLRRANGTRYVRVLGESDNE